MFCRVRPNFPSKVFCCALKFSQFQARAIAHVLPQQPRLMYLRCRGYRRPLAVESPYGAWRSRNPAALRPPVSQSERQSLRILRGCQWSLRSYSHTATVAEEATAPPGDSSYTSPQTNSTDLEAPPSLVKPRTVSVFKYRYVSLGQAQHDSGVQSREDWEKERYADQIAALLPVSPDAPPKKQNPRFVLYGKNKADRILVSQLLKDKGRTSYDWRIPLLQLEQYYKPQYVEATAESEGLFCKGDTARRVYIEPNRALTLARDVPEPKSWSEASLLFYIEDATESQASQARISPALKPQHRDWSNVTDIADIIYHLFHRRALRTLLTVDACNTALRFFYKHGMFSRARAIYIQMETMKMPIPTETFNIILRSAAGHRDLHNFSFLLHNMIQRGFRPDEETWVNLLMAINSTAVRAVILYKMKENNMLGKPGIGPDVAALMVQHDLTFHLGNGHSFDEFLNHMDSRYGVRWLSTSAGNSLLNESGKRRSAVESLDLLDGMKQRGFIPDEVSINTLLRKCLLFRQDKDAIEILHAFYGQFDLRPRHLVHETLFVQAWKNRMLNFARVIWRLACIGGFVTFTMRKLVFRSLLANTSEDASTPPPPNHVEQRSLDRSKAFNELAGKFVVGVREPQEPELGELRRIIWDYSSDPQRRNVKRAQVHMNRDLVTAQSFRTKIGMVELLRQALELDKKWAAKGLWRIGGRQLDLRHGVQVDIEEVKDVARVAKRKG